ncbi:hypothetical protein AB0K00_15035 [Dactylosporangium sp. NPDC049525]|uniref:hypothetical protein n=1 Tax=Dactylosporangium sp. NPDC049525 TaxID=3154730 RepID=UPI00341D2F9C
MADDARNTLAVWRTLMLVGIIGNAIGLIGDVPILTLIFAPVALVGAIGFLVAKQRAKARS